VRREPGVGVAAASLAAGDVAVAMGVASIDARPPWGPRSLGAAQREDPLVPLGTTLGIGGTFSRIRSLALSLIPQLACLFEELGGKVGSLRRPLRSSLRGGSCLNDLDLKLAS